MSSITTVNLENARGSLQSSTYDLMKSETAEAVYVVSYDSEGAEFETIKTGTVYYGEHITLSGKKYMETMCLIQASEKEERKASQGRLCVRMQDFLAVD